MRVAEKNWYKLIKSTSFNDGFYPDSYGGFQIQMSLDTIKFNRSIYNILDFLGDVGGLYSILCDICNILIMVPGFFFGSLLQRFLKSKIFESPTDADGSHFNKHTNIDNNAQVK